MALVLCTGVYPVLIKTRKLILEHAGHTVIPCTDELQLVVACEEHAFDVAVIGQAVSRKVKRHIALLIRQNCPSVKILELYLVYEGRAVDDADSWMEAPLPVPEELAVRVTELANALQRQARSVQQ
jgi:CheY-like chemotaxis protein